MSIGGQQLGSTTTSGMPAGYMQPYYGTALSYAGNLLNSPGPQYYPGQTVAGFSKPQEQAFRRMQRVDNQLISGSGNPYEDAMFQQAAGATQNQLASEFAGSGRNVEASEPLRAEQLNNLATQIYGGQYQNDVNNAFMAGNNLLGIGNQVQGQAQRLIDANKAKYDYYQNLPNQQLSAFLSAIGALQPGSIQTSTKDPLTALMDAGANAEKLYANLP